MTLQAASRSLEELTVHTFVHRGPRLGVQGHIDMQTEATTF